MILIDSNIPMYLVGAAHPHKQTARRVLERLVGAEERLVTDAEVLQEILHRYTAINRREAIGPAFQVMSQLVDEVFPVDRAAVERARDILLGHPRLSARDAIHVAIMQTEGIRRILSFDSGFDSVPDLERLSE